MTLVIKNKNYNVDTFSISYDCKVNQEAIHVSVKDVEDFRAFALEIRSIFEGDFSIITKIQTYVFEGYTLESTDVYIDDTYNTVQVRFTKDIIQ